jgi:hypothetical protein
VFKTHFGMDLGTWKFIAAEIVDTHTYVRVYNVKVKLSLCLTKHHAMKTYWGSGVIAPRNLDLGTRWK